MLSVIIAVDPGLNACGLSCLINGRLRWAALARLGAGEDMAIETAHLIEMALTSLHVDERVFMALEKPQIYNQRHRKGNQEPLIDLAILLGRIAGIMHYNWSYELAYYMPAQWKGQVPKEVHHKRLIQQLDRDEPDWKACVEKTPASLLHNVYDAIGLGFHHDKVLTNRAAVR